MGEGLDSTYAEGGASIGGGGGGGGSSSTLEGLKRTFDGRIALLRPQRERKGAAKRKRGVKRNRSRMGAADTSGGQFETTDLGRQVYRGHQKKRRGAKSARGNNNKDGKNRPHKRQKLTDDNATSSSSKIEHTNKNGEKQPASNENSSEDPSQRVVKLKKGGEQQEQPGEESQSKKKKQKKKKKKPPPKPRVICTAEETLARCIERTKSSTGGSRHSDDLEDVPKEHIPNLPPVPHGESKGGVVLVVTPEASASAVAAIRAELHEGDGKYGNLQCVGFDIETKPKFRKGKDHHPPALLQIATESVAYLFRLRHRGRKRVSVLTESLTDLLSDPSIVKVGVGVRKDVEDLRRAYGPDVCGDGGSYLDLAPLANLRWPKLKRTGLRNLTATVLRWKLSKAQQMKDWETERLTPAMMRYAASDAWVALDLLWAILE